MFNRTKLGSRSWWGISLCGLPVPVMILFSSFTIFKFYYLRWGISLCGHPLWWIFLKLAFSVCFKHWLYTRTTGSGWAGHSGPKRWDWKPQHSQLLAFAATPWKCWQRSNFETQAPTWGQNHQVPSLKVIIFKFYWWSLGGEDQTIWAYLSPSEPTKGNGFLWDLSQLPGSLTPRRPPEEVPTVSLDCIQVKLSYLVFILQLISGQVT